ncbi:MAG TPA: response regulator [Devosia sp.]|nr:response regulator [Devosia sp.]
MREFLPRRILLVEDDPLTAIMIGEILHDLGHWVIGPCHTLEEGLSAARSGGIDMALLDFELGPDTDAVPIAQALAEQEVPFAFATGKDPHRVSSLYSGRPVLAKPVAPSEIEATIVELGSPPALH